MTICFGTFIGVGTSCDPALKCRLGFPACRRINRCGPEAALAGHPQSMMQA